jgi:cellobiose phosphorylase
MINPLNHAKTEDEISVYKTEPYVVAADVYGVSSFIGRGGWTWYTGSAGWMYQLIMESLLGLKKEGDSLWVLPASMHPDWKSFTLHYRHDETVYHILVKQSEEDRETKILMDGKELPDTCIPLVNDGHEHAVEVYFFSKLYARNSKAPVPGL